MALADQANLVVSLSLKDNLSGALRGVQGNLNNLSSATSNTQASLAKLGTNVVRAGIIGVGVVVGGLAAGFGVAIRAAADFEGQLNTINTVAKLSADELTEVGDGLRKLAIDTGKPVEELTTAYYDLVSAGVDAADAQEVLTRATTLATGGLGTTQETVNLLTTAMNSYGLTAEEVADATDMFAQAIGAGKVTASELASSFATIGPVAASASVELEEVAAAYAQMTASGIPAAEAATAMRSAITALQTPNENLLAMQKKLNVNFEDVAAEEGLAVAYQMIRDEADKQGISLMTLTGNVNANAYALSVSGENAAGFAANMDAVRASTDGAGVAAAQAAERNKGLGFQLDKLKVIGSDVAIMFGERMLPSVTRITTKLGELIALNYSKLQRLADNVGDAFDRAFSDDNLTKGIGKISTKVGELLDALGKIDSKDIEGVVKDVFGFLRDLPWNTIAEGMRITGQAAKVALDAFKGLPPDVQKGLITLLAANKLSGGLVTSVFKDIGGIMLKSLTTINAANVTVVGGNVTGGGVPGAPTSAAGNLLGALGPITIGAVAAVAVDQFALSSAKSLRETPVTVGQLGTFAQSGLASIAAHANDPMMQFFAGTLGPGVRELAGEVGNLGDTALTTNQTLGRNAEGVWNTYAATMALRVPALQANGLLQINNQLGADHRSELADIHRRAQEQNRLSQIGNHAAQEAKDRLASIQISSQKTAQKDFSVDVRVNTSFNVSAREIANQVYRARYLNTGALE